MLKLPYLAAAALGTAALAAICLSPAVASATTSTLTAQRTAAITYSTAPALRVASAIATVPDIEAQSCTSATTHWVRLYEYSGGSLCIGFAGIYYPPQNNWDNDHEVAFCAGNNSGSFAGYTETGVYKDFSFSPGDFFWFYSEPGGVLDITDVYITGYSGSATCPSG